MDSIWTTLDEIQGYAGEMPHAPEAGIVMTAPPGAGKTALIAHTIKEATSRGMVTARLDPRLLSGPEDKLVSNMLPEDTFKKVYGRKKRVPVDYSGIMDTGVDLDNAKGSLRYAMYAVLSKMPLLLMVEEAQLAHPDALTRVFDLSQKCMRMSLPLALIVADTPGLDTHLRECKASYIERSNFLKFNTLSDDEAKEALDVPAKESGLAMDPKASKILRDWSGNFPYFLQMAGEQAWQVASDSGDKKITPTHAKTGLEAAGKARDAYLEKQYQQIVSRELEKYALQAIKLQRDGEGRENRSFVFMDRMEELNEELDSRTSLHTFEALQDVGLIWVDYRDVEAGIPFLFDYVLDRQQ